MIREISKALSKTLSKIILIIIFTITINLAFENSANAQEEKQQKKITYSEAEKQTMLTKLEDLDKNNKLKYGEYLTKKEQMIRLEMMKKKYPIKWYDDKLDNFDTDDCNVQKNDKAEGCAQVKMLCWMTEDQVISIFLHYDEDMEYHGSERMDSIIDVILTIAGINHYIEYFPFSDASYYSQNKLSGYELEEMIRSHLILVKYKEHMEYIKKSVDGLLNHYYNFN